MGLLALAAASALIWRWAYQTGPAENGIDRYTLRGIDISHHQGLVDWPRVPREIRFAYLKASEGETWIDPMFLRNVASAPRSGIALGAYHYFTLCASGKSQAENLLKAIAAAPNLALPPAIDLEYVGNCNARPLRSAVVHELQEFISVVRHATGESPVLYSTAAFFGDYLSGKEFAGATYWVRDLRGERGWPGNRRVMFRQLSNHAHVNGIAGSVDVDVFTGSRAEFAQLTSGGGHTREIFGRELP